MKMSCHLGKSEKQAPKKARMISHQLMLRGGYLRETKTGLYCRLPLYTRTLKQLNALLDRELDAMGAEEILLPLGPAIEPAAQNRSSNHARDGQGPCLSVSAAISEFTADLLGRDIVSFKQLPLFLHQSAVRSEPGARSRDGVIDARQALIREIAGFALSSEAEQMLADALAGVFNRLAEHTRLVCHWAEDLSSTGWDRLLLAPALIGPTDILRCRTCGYAATPDSAGSKIAEYEQDTELRVMESIDGPGLIQVEPLAAFLNIPVWKTTKTLLFQADDQTVAVMLRGDCDASAAKIKYYLGCQRLVLTPPELLQTLTRAAVGYAGPIGLPAEVRLLGDEYVRGRVNFECGANQTNHHLINVNFGRDCPLPEFADFKLSRAGQGCPNCNEGRLETVSGIRLALLQGLAPDPRRRPLGLTCMGRDGKPEPLTALHATLWLENWAAAVIEQHHDDKGIIWPMAMAPFKVYLIGLNLKDEALRRAAEALYRELWHRGIDTLYDERDAGAGAKFADAELFGIPLYVTLSSRTFADQTLEIKFRDTAQRLLLGHAEALSVIAEKCQKLAE
jgi:prolyl-tRNA synthetase